MHSTKKYSRLITLLIAIVFVAVLIPATPTHGEAASQAAPGFAGKTLSILGDSISTYTNYSNGSAAQTTNSTITNGAVYYPRSGFSVTPESTWWFQAAQTLGMEILVNNSWSGSCMLNTRSGTVGAYIDRCVQLHDDTGDNAGQEPDIIAIFLGTNDYYSSASTLGSFEAVVMDTLINQNGDTFTYGTPTTCLEAYAISLHKIAQRYPNAEVYCFTLLPKQNAQPANLVAFNEDICQLADYFGAYVVDLHDCGVQYPTAAFNILMGDSLHPDVKGMDAMTNAFLSSLYKNSKYMAEDTAVYDVSWSLKDVVAEQGTSKAILGGEPYQVSLTAVSDYYQPLVTVTMGGEDITQSCYADGIISIESVTGNISIAATAVEAPPEPEQVPQIERELTSFRWEYDAESDQLINVTGGVHSANGLTMTHGSVSNGQFTNARYTLDETIYLNHDRPWSIEWKSEGSWGNDGGLLFAQASSSATTGARYLYRRKGNTMFALGEHDSGTYNNYAVEFSGTGIDTTKEHVYCLTNRIAADGTNMIYLYVDGVEVGPLDQYYNGATDKNTSSNWLCGKNFQFNYIGTTPHTITSCSIEYIQVWENGIPQQEVIDFYGTNMTLGTDFSLNFFIVKSDLVNPNCYVEIVKEDHNDPEDLVRRIPYSEFTEQGDLWKISFSGITAKEMSDAMTVTLHLNDGTCVSNPYTMSIRDYAMQVIENDEISQEMKELAQQMLRYGAFAQKFFDYNTEDLADKLLPNT